MQQNIVLAFLLAIQLVGAADPRSEDPTTPEPTVQETSAEDWSTGTTVDLSTSTTGDWSTGTNPTATTTTYPPEGCPPGWVNSLEGCFLFQYYKNVTWREAQDECERIGGFLAESKNVEQALLLTSLAFLAENITGTNAWWIGLTDQGHEGRWIWQHSVEDSDYTNWAPSYPENSNNEDDCAIMSSWDSFMWSDVDCEGLLASPVCQRETDGSDGTTTVDTTTTTAYEYHVELRDGDGYSSGNVFVVNDNGYLGPVCDDDWRDAYASIVCRQLGFTSGLATTNSYFANVPSQFAMDDLYCEGYEDTIQQCRYSTHDDCGAAEGAGVKCS